jgi:hypothetical protein
MPATKYKATFFPDDTAKDTLENDKPKDYKPKNYKATFYPEPSDVEAAIGVAESVKRDARVLPEVAPQEPQAEEPPVQEPPPITRSFAPTPYGYPTDEAVPPLAAREPMSPEQSKKELINLLNQEAGYAPATEGDDTPAFRQGGYSSLYRNIFAAPQAKVQNVLALSKETGLKPSQSMDMYDKLTKDIRQTPTNEELVIGLMTPAIATGLASNPVGVLTSVATFMGLSEAESYIISKATGKPWVFGEHRGLSDLSQGDLDDRWGFALDTIDFLGKSALVSAKTPLLKMLKEQTWYRKLTNRERGLTIVNTLDNMRKAGYSQQEMDTIITGTINSMKQAGMSQKDIDIASFRLFKILGARGKGSGIPEPPPPGSSIESIMDYINRYGKETPPKPQQKPSTPSDIITAAEEQLSRMEKPTVPIVTPPPSTAVPPAPITGTGVTPPAATPPTPPQTGLPVAPPESPPVAPVTGETPVGETPVGELPTVGEQPPTTKQPARKPKAAKKPRPVPKPKFIGDKLWISERGITPAMSYVRRAGNYRNESDYFAGVMVGMNPVASEPFLIHPYKKEIDQAKADMRRAAKKDKPYYQRIIDDLTERGNNTDLSDVAVQNYNQFVEDDGGRHPGLQKVESWDELLEVARSDMENIGSDVAERERNLGLTDKEEIELMNTAIEEMGIADVEPAMTMDDVVRIARERPDISDYIVKMRTLPEDYNEQDISADTRSGESEGIQQADETIRRMEEAEGGTDEDLSDFLDFADAEGVSPSERFAIADAIHENNNVVNTLKYDELKAVADDMIENLQDYEDMYGGEAVAAMQDVVFTKMGELDVVRAKTTSTGETPTRFRTIKADATTAMGAGIDARSNKPYKQGDKVYRMQDTGEIITEETYRKLTELSAQEDVLGDTVAEDKNANKQPWQVPLDEWLELRRKQGSTDTAMESAAHENAVALALAMGKNIPTTVLSGYKGIRENPVYVAERDRLMKDAGEIGKPEDKQTSMMDGLEAKGEIPKTATNIKDFEFDDVSTGEEPTGDIPKPPSTGGNSYGDTGGYADIENKAHLTAISRTQLSAPMKMLNDKGLIKGRSLDYGSGRGYDADQLKIEKYDPYYSPIKPSGMFDTIVSNYVLNVIVGPKKRLEVIKTILSMLKPDGVAYITVRRDVKTSGITSRGTFQDNIELPYESIIKTSGFETYKITKSDKSSGGKGSTSYGDTGGYADIPPKVPPLNEFKDKTYANIAAIVRLPEVVEFARALMLGKLPRVMKRIRGLAVGQFIASGEGSIEIEANLAQNIDILIKVITHEIGHLVDYMPDHIMKRGNIFGHIAALYKYGKHTLPQYPGAPGALTEKDRARLRRIAEKMMTATEIEIDEEIIRETPVTPEDVLSIWRDSENEILKHNPKLFEFISRLTGKEKKSIVKEAMRGIVPERLKQFASISREKTGRKIKQKIEPTKEDIRRQYQKLVEEEIKKRALYTLSDMTKELREFTMKWKPFNPNLNPEYTKYRFSPQELYADAFSALVTNPQYLMDNAPHFYEAFFNYIDERPTVKAEWDRMQSLMRSGEANKELAQRMDDGFIQWEQEMAEGIKARSNEIMSRDEWGALLIDQYYAVLRHVKKVGEKNIPENINPRYAIERLQLTGSRDEGYLSEMHRNVLDKMKDTNISLNDLNRYVTLKRIAGQRKDVPNPLGITPEIAKEMMAEMEDMFGDTIKELDRDFRQIRKEWFLDKAVEAKVHDPELLEMMQGHLDDYVRFDIAGHLDHKYGKLATSHIYETVGTFSPNGPPITATLLHDMAIMRSINHNIMKQRSDDFFKTYYPEMREPAKKQFNGRFMEFVEPRDPSKGLVVYLKDGELHGYYYPRTIANAMRSSSIEMSIYGDFLRSLSGGLRHVSAPFKTLLTGKNPGFMLVNLQRDYLSTVKNTSGMTIANFFHEYVDSVAEAFLSTFGGEMSPAVRTLLKNNALISVANYRADAPQDVELTRMLKRFNIIAQHTKESKPANEAEAMAQLKELMSAIYEFALTSWDNLDRVGSAIERIPKIAGYKWLLKNKPDMGQEAMFHAVRTTIGSPPFMRRATLTPIVDPFLLYINARKEGWRASAEAFSNDKWDYAWKTFKYNVLPRLIFYSMSLGLIGAYAPDDSRRKKISNKLISMCKRISLYDKINYINIPIGMDKNGESIYYRIIQDEIGQFIGGLVSLAVEHELMEIAPKMTEYMGGQVPSINPLVGVIVATAEYAAGNNPYDWFRGSYVVDPRTFSAGGWKSHKQFATWVWNQVGGGIIHQFPRYDYGQDKSLIKRIVQYPGLSNTVGRFVKVTDIGVSQDISKDLEKLQQHKDKLTVDAYDGVVKVLEGKRPSDDEFKAIAERFDRIDDYTLKAMSRKYGNIYLRRFNLASTTDEKIIILKHMYNDPIVREMYNDVFGKNPVK